MYDLIVVGAGLYGSVFAEQAANSGQKVLILESRDHIGGNCYTQEIEGIQIHKYGPHIFHTNSDQVWKYLNRFTEFNNFVYSPKAFYKGKMYSLPINLNTFYEFFGCHTPSEAKRELSKRKHQIDNPKNLEEWILSQVGSEIYETLIKGYTKKQWNKDPKDLPSSIIRRLPLRFTYNNNYFNAKYQGIPVDGYTAIFDRMLDNKNIEIKTNTPFDHSNKKLGKTLLYTGPIDSYFGYKFGKLEYRSLEFKHSILEGDFQGMAGLNFTAENVPFTRIIEHKHFYFLNSPKTVITREYPSDSGDKYYPINNTKNNDVYSKYSSINEENVIFGGRLASYKYWDMDQTVAASLKQFKKYILGSV